MKKEIAEFIGTFTLVFLGCGAAVIAGGLVGILGIAIAFGLALIAMAYGIGHISGCHINPAVSIGALVAGRMGPMECIRYIIAQCLGGLAGACVLLLIMKGNLNGFDIASSGLGQNGWGAEYMGGFDMQAAFLFELIATFLFMTVILGVTGEDGPAGMAGLAIGLTLIVIHIVGINVTGVSVNPARSFGPALLVGGTAMSQLWLFIAAPCLGAVLAGLCVRMGWIGK